MDRSLKTEKNPKILEERWQMERIDKDDVVAVTVE